MSRFAIKRLDRNAVTPLGNLIKGDTVHVIAEGGEAMARIEEQGRLAYHRGFEQGKQDAEAAGRQAAAALMASSAAAAQRFWKKSERRLVGIVVDAVRRVIGEFDDTEVAARMVGRLICEVRDEGKIRLRVSPALLADVETRILEIKQHYPDVEAIEVIQDAAIEEDGCCIETELGIVETSVEAQIESLVLALEQHFDEHEPAMKM